MASASSPSGASSRRPLIYLGKRVRGVYERTTASGETRYEYQTQANGKQTRETLSARTPTDAVNEVKRLCDLSAEQRITDRALRISNLLERFLDETRSGQYVAPRGALAESTLDLYEQRLRSHVLPALGESTRLRDVRVEHLRQLIDRMRGEELSGSTIRGTIAAVRALLRFAVHRGLLDRSPALDLDGDLPSGARTSEPVYLSRPEIDSLLDGLGDEFRPIAATCAFCALRISECLGLTWSDLDFAAGTMRVEKQLARNGKERVELKTATSRATLAIPAPLVEELLAHRQRQARISFERVKPEALVFQTRTGKPQSKRNSLRAVQVVADRLGLRNSGGELLGLHDLRHSTAGLLREAGLPDEEIALVLRHANSKVTSTMYGGRSDDATQAVRRAAAEALA